MEITFEEIEESGRQLYNNFQSSLRAKIAADKTYAEEAAEAVCSIMVDELLTEVVGEVHRAAKLGYIDFMYSRIYDRSLDDKDLPFYPENEDSKTEDINCPKCHKLIHASRFAPHLEKCMQPKDENGRSRRKASQRIASSSKECLYAMGSDEDEEWKAEKSRSGKKKKDSARKQKSHKSELVKNQRDTGNSITSNIKDMFNSPNRSIRDSFKGSKEQDSDAWISPNKGTPVVSEDKLTALLSRCSVKSNHTGKYCGRSLRCPLHSDAERAVARKLLTGESMDIDAEEADCSKSVAGGISQLNLTSSSPISKKKEKQKHGITKY